MSARTFVIGVGMTKFDKPGTKEGDYPDWAKEAGEKALADAGIPYDGRRAGLRRLLLRRLDLRPARALRARPHRHPGRQRQQQLLDRLVGAVPRSPGGPAAASPTARSRSASRRWRRARSASSTPTAPTRSTSTRWRCSRSAIRRSRPPAPQMFGNAGRDHMDKYGSKPDHYAWIGWKNHKHSVNNPYAQFQTEYTLDEIKDARMIHAPLTKLQCSPTSDGAACAIVASERFVDEHGLWDQAVEIAGQAMVTDLSLDVRRRHRLHQDRRLRHVEAGRRQAYEEAGVDARRGRRLRAARLLQRQRADHLRGARLRRRGRGPQARRGRGDDLRRRRPGRQPVGRADLQGPPARRHRPRPVLRAHLAAARHRRRAPGRRRQGRAPAQHRPRRRRRRDRLQARRQRSGRRREAKRR